jgi:hypothetical protein
MPRKISQLEAATDVTASDLIQIIDIEDTGMAVSGTNKRATAQLMANELGKLTNITATGSTAARTLENRFADVVNVRDFGDADGIGDVTLNIPSQYPTIQSALAYLLTKQINSGTRVVIKVADGTYIQNQTVRVAHPQGGQISIIGNTSNPANCILSCSTSDGFYVPPGYQLGELNGFRIINTTTRSSSTPYLGIFTDGGIYLKVGPKIEVHNFYYGIAARNGGQINASGNASSYIKVTNAGDVGIWAFNKSFVNCDYAEASYCDDSANGLGGGVVAEFSSSIQATGINCHDNWLCGISCLSSSAIRAWSCNLQDNKHGVVAGSGGVVEVFGGSIISNNTNYGFHCSDGNGFAYGLGTATMSGNSLGNTYTGFEFASDGTTKIRSGSIEIDGTQPGQVTGGDAYVDINSASNKFPIVRFLVNDSEKSRIQYNDASSFLALNGSNKTSLRFFPDTGKTTIGVGSPLTTATSGHLQIPSHSGPPTGTVDDVQSGFVPIVYDTSSNKLYVWNASGATPAWKSVTLS